MPVNVKLTLHSTVLDHQMALLGGMSAVSKCQSDLTLHSTALDQQMPLLGGTFAFFNSFWVWLLHHRGPFYERPMSAEQNYSNIEHESPGFLQS